MVGLTERDFLTPGETIAEGDSYILNDFLPHELSEVAFENLKKEVKWSTMMHRGKLSLEVNVRMLGIA